MKSSASYNGLNIVVDSGSTKAHWLTIDNEFDFTTLGLNPTTQPIESIRSTLSQVRESIQFHPVDSMHFYGSGCTGQGKELLRREIIHYINPNKLTIESDLMGACRATLHTNEGMVGIVGTGSNICFYDGTYITVNGFSGGYILGDEGSGFDIGKHLLTDYMRHVMPEELATSFNKEYDVNKDHIISTVYHSQYPNRHIATLAMFADSHAEHPYIQELLNDRLQAFVEQQVVPLQRQCGCHCLSLVGSVAFAYADRIRAICLRHNITVTTIIKEPIYELASYHKTEVKHKKNEF